MSRRKKDPLRPAHRRRGAALTQLSRSQAAPAAQVARAIMLLAVARGDDYQQAARAAGRRSGDAVSHLVARFNAEGLAALTPRHGGGRSPVYDQAARERILGRGQAAPDPGGRRDGDLVVEHPAEGVAVRPRRPARGSRPTPSGRSSTGPATATSTPAPGAPPARPCAAARPARWSSPTRTPSQKKVDRGRLPPRARRWACRSGAPTRPGRSRRCRNPARPGGPRASRRGSRTSTSATARPRS